jgi:hypothetical protein
MIGKCQERSGERRRSRKVRRLPDAPDVSYAPYGIVKNPKDTYETLKTKSIIGIS